MAMIIDDNALVHYSNDTDDNAVVCYGDDIDDNAVAHYHNYTVHYGNNSNDYDAVIALIFMIILVFIKTINVMFNLPN